MARPRCNRLTVVAICERLCDVRSVLSCECADGLTQFTCGSESAPSARSDESPSNEASSPAPSVMLLSEVERSAETEDDDEVAVSESTRRTVFGVISVMIFVNF